MALQFNSERKVQERKEKMTDPKSGKGENTEGIKDFADGAYWRQLFPNFLAIKELKNAIFQNSRALIIDAEEAKYVPVRYNFVEIFDCAVFKGNKKVKVQYFLGMCVILKRRQEMKVS